MKLLFKYGIGFFGWALFLTALASPVAAQTGTSLFSEANAKYQAGQFKEAAELYKKSSESERPTAAVYYNLGNTCFRLGQKGEALINYERALKISPRDPDVRWNIGILKSVLADRLDDLDGGILRMWSEQAIANFTINEISALFTLLLGVFMFLSLLTVLFPNFKNAARALRLVIYLLAVAAGVLFYFKWLDVKDPRVVVVAKEVEVRYGPSDRETKAFLLHEGAEAKVLDHTNDWNFITLKNKNSGWIRKESCEVI